jgi:hypothetical protein
MVESNQRGNSVEKETPIALLCGNKQHGHVARGNKLNNENPSP